MVMEDMVVMVDMEDMDFIAMVTHTGATMDMEAMDVDIEDTTSSKITVY